MSRNPEDCDLTKRCKKKQSKAKTCEAQNISTQNIRKAIFLFKLSL